MRTLRSTSAFELFDRLDQQLQQQRVSSEHTPAVEINDYGDAYEVLVELPGIDRSSLEVSATERSLAIAAQRPASRAVADTEGASRDAVTLVSEFRPGPWRRSVRFPSSIDRDQLQATYRDGLLRVRAVKANTRTTVPITIIEG